MVFKLAWARNGTPDTLSSTGDTLTISDLTAKKFNQFISHVISNATIIEMGLTFNNNTNSVYTRRVNENGVADSTLASQTSILYALDYDTDKLFVSYFISISGEEKLGITFWVTSNADGAGNAPGRVEMVSKFVPSPDADITRIDYTNTQSGDYQIDSNLSALGTD